MHLQNAQFVRAFRNVYDFQFPLLGIFPCTFLAYILVISVLVTILSIPVTWDFSMHLLTGELRRVLRLSFNSRYLGFFHAPVLQVNNTSRFRAITFNSRYLGFFHAPTILSVINHTSVTYTFNSRYLGFFHAP